MMLGNTYNWQISQTIEQVTFFNLIFIFIPGRSKKIGTRIETYY